MKLLLEEEAYSYYNKYAETIGFSIRRSTGHKLKNSLTMQQRTFTCSRQGKGFMKKKYDNNHIFMH
jgi:hypothetical protein